MSGFAQRALAWSAVAAVLSGACCAPGVESAGSGDSEAPASFHRASTGKHNSHARFRGHLLSGRELSGFVACGSTDVWWFTVGSVRAPGLALLRTGWRSGCYKQTGDPACDSSLYVEFDGTSSPPGNYGHMGWYGRELRASRIYYAANFSPSDCPVRRLWPRQRKGVKRGDLTPNPPPRVPPPVSAAAPPP